MYEEFIKKKFPHNDELDMFVRPKLPAVKLGKALAKDTRVANPGDVVAVHMHGGLFNSSLVILTGNKCFYPGGSFLLEDVQGAEADGKNVQVMVNQGGIPAPQVLSVKNEEVAKILRKLFGDLAYFDAKTEKQVEKSYEGLDFNEAEINWLKLRDEVMSTIDMLSERFNDGKLSLLQFEEKKEELLSRL